MRFTHSLLLIALTLVASASAGHGPGPYLANDDDQIPPNTPKTAKTTWPTWPVSSDIFLPGPVMTSDIGLPSSPASKHRFPTLSLQSTEGVFPPADASCSGFPMTGTGTAVPTQQGPKFFPTGLEPPPVPIPTTLETYTRPMPRELHHIKHGE
ncbi:hypothetical protein BZA77DRAFT_318635 [Pyronema omphalodes]|nr:hypothetical protein BZA77DRAFT_318635 [Pyronema omphalodes]